MIRRHLLVMLLFVVCLSQSTLAQTNPFRNSVGTSLNDNDIAALTDATNRRMDQPQLVTGATETWNNPESGARGTIIAGVLPWCEMACRAVRYQSTVPGPNAGRSVTLTWCKTSDGWKIG
jgi:hypothetical protein